MTATQDKHLLRQQCKQQRDALPERAGRSAAICEQIMSMPIYQAARVLHCYLPMRSEVDTRPLLLAALAQEKRVVVPVVRRGDPVLAHSWLTSLAAEDIVAGVFGTPQPRVLQTASPGDWHLVVVPLLAFDRRGHRLGYGAGYYDRLLEVAPVPAIGVAFAAQEVEQVPCETHDSPLDWIVTEQEIITPGA